MGIMGLSAERHYMGSAASGRYSTDRDRRPDYTRLPDAATIERREAAQPAWLARYLREQDVVTLVLDCADAKERENAAEAQLASLRERLDRADQEEEHTEAQRQVTIAQHTYETARDRRRYLSGQLRLLGISPKAEAAIARAALERISAYEESATASREVLV